MLKVWVLVLFPTDSMPVEIAAYDTQGDCLEVGDFIIEGSSFTYICEERE